MREILPWRDATTPRGAAVFIGDSITERLAVADVTGNGVNFGISWARTDQLYVPKAVGRASRIYLLIGANDFMQSRQSNIDQRLATIVGQLPRNVPLVWTGIMLSAAAQTNRSIKAMCAARPLCTYVEPLTDQRLFVDGIHPTVAGYREWSHRLQRASESTAQPTLSVKPSPHGSPATIPAPISAAH